MATKKGIAVTVAIVAAIVAASFLIWFIPVSNPALTESEIISDVYSRHDDRLGNVEVMFEDWRKGNVTSDDILDEIGAARTDIQGMRDQIEDANPGAQWQRSFDLYVQALESSLEYLDAIESRVNAGDTSEPSTEMSDLMKEWRTLVDESVAAMPLAQ